MLRKKKERDRPPKYPHAGVDRCRPRDYLRSGAPSQAQEGLAV